MPLPIVRWPDPALAMPTVPVETSDAALEALAADLLETMRAAPGIGITAPHVGRRERLTVVEVEPGRVLVLVNPAVTAASTETRRHAEGSVSMPGATAEVERPARVTVGYRDLSGAERTIEADGLLAVTLQHEIDQLDGIFWLDRLSRLKRDRLIKAWKKSW